MNQHDPNQPFQYDPQGLQPPTEQKPKHTGRNVLIGAGAVVAVLTVIGLAFSGGDPQQVAATPQPTTTVTVTAPAEPGAEVTVTAPPVTVTKTAPPAKPAEPSTSATIEEGTWEVGVDVAPGRYKPAAAVESGAMCYWKITTTGKPDDIVDNDIVTGGRPTVTIKKGQDFTTSQDCGTWQKVS